MSNTYSMQSRLVWADLGAESIRRELLAAYATPSPRRSTIIDSIENVENDSYYQQKDIDLIIRRKDILSGDLSTSSVEIKCDSYPSGDIGVRRNQGNFFLELVSNDTKRPRTKGCFLYCEADLFYYLFATTGTLYVMPMTRVRESFLKRIPIDEHRLYIDQNSVTEIRNIPGLKHTSTYVGGKVAYRTWGCAVPISVVAQWAKEDGWVLQKRGMLATVFETAQQMGVADKLWEKMPAVVQKSLLPVTAGLTSKL